MSNTEKPQDIKQRTFAFALQVVGFCRTLEKTSEVTRSLSRQLLRAGTSIGANVEEAQAGQSQADFVNKYNIALKEARETIYWLRLLDASGQSANGQCKSLFQEADEISRVIGSIIVSTKKVRKISLFLPFYFLLLP